LRAEATRLQPLRVYDRQAIALRSAKETGLLDPLAGPNSLLWFAHSYGEIAVSHRKKGAYEDVRNGTEGSNPDLSATQSGLQRNRAALLQESLKIAAILQVLPLNRTGESGPSNVTG